MNLRAILKPSIVWLPILAVEAAIMLPQPLTTGEQIIIVSAGSLAWSLFGLIDHFAGRAPSMVTPFLLAALLWLAIGIAWATFS